MTTGKFRSVLTNGMADEPVPIQSQSLKELALHAVPKEQHEQEEGTNQAFKDAVENVYREQVDRIPNMDGDDFYESYWWLSMMDGGERIFQIIYPLDNEEPVPADYIKERLVGMNPLQIKHMTQSIISIRFYNDPAKQREWLRKSIAAKTASDYATILSGISADFPVKRPSFLDIG